MDRTKRGRKRIGPNAHTLTINFPEPMMDRIIEFMEMDQQPDRSSAIRKLINIGLSHTLPEKT